jgi:hypothetical protein
MSEVTSVNTKTGAVVLKASDVEAVPASSVGVPSGVASLNGSGKLPEAQLANAVVRSSASSVMSTSKMPVRAIEEYSSEAIKSGETDCTVAFKAALEDVAALPVPIQLLGKVYIVHSALLLPSYIHITGAGCFIDEELGSIIKLSNGSGAVNVLQSENWGSAAQRNTGITLSDFGVSGNMLGQAESGIKAMPQTYLMVEHISGETSITVFNTEGFPASGLIWAGKVLFEYTGTTEKTFTGCKAISSDQALSPGAWITPHNSQGHGIAIQGECTRSVNLSITNTQASNLIIQGTPSRIAYENAFVNAKLHTSNRFAVELAEQASDNNFIAPVLGNYNGMGQILMRAGDNSFVHPHLVGGISPQPASVIVAGSDLRMSHPFFDSIPYNCIRLDSALRGNSAVVDPHVTDISGVHWNYCGSPTASFMATRRSGGESCIRGRFTGVVGSEEPYYKSAVRVGPAAQLVGEQNPTTLSTEEGGSGMLQLDCVAEFLDAPTAAQTIKIGTDTLTYQSKAVAISSTSGSAAAGATVLKLNTIYIRGSAKFAKAGMLLVAGNKLKAPQEITYSAYNESTHEFTGIPATGPGSVTATIPAETPVSQSFLAGASGAKSKTSYAAGTAATMSSEKMFNQAFFDLSGPQATPLLSLQELDLYNVRRGWERANKASFFMGSVTIAEGKTVGEVAHKCFAEPAELFAQPKSLPGSGVNWKVTATATNIIVTLSAAAPGGGVTFSVMAECLMTA